MGSAASINSASTNKLQTIIDRGDKELSRVARESSAVLPPLVVQLLQMKLGLTAVHDTLPPWYTHLLDFSKGEDVGGDLKIIECTSEEDILSTLLASGEEEDACLILSAECAGINSLAAIDEHLRGGTDADEPTSVKGINLSGNQCSEGDISSCRLFALPSLSYLHIGGNKVQSLAPAMQSICSSSLLILDLSYTESLQLSVFDFLYLPQLRRLVLDGCNLETTVGNYPDSEEEISLFWGLVELQELSLRENILSDISSLAGLAFFNISAVDADVSARYIANIISPTLTHLWLSGNPFRDITAASNEVDGFIKLVIPSLQLVDDRPVQKISTTEGLGIDLSRVLKRDSFGASPTSAVSGSIAFEIMEKEYLAAL